MLDSVTCGDWRDLLRAIEPGSVDLCLTDMPYALTNCAWDKRPDLDEWWRLVKPVMKPRGAVVCTASAPFSGLLMVSNLQWFKYEWVWKKTRPTGFANAKIMPLKITENICVFGGQSFYPQGLRKVNLTMRNSKSTGGKGTGAFNYGGLYFQENTDYPTNILEYPSVDNPLHPTQKPVALFEYLIRTYTRPGDLVVDPFVGSGTTALAARNTGRHFIVGDSDAGYCEIARRRLAEPYTLQMFPDEPDEQTAEQLALGLTPAP